jgi:hypothetical protein
MKEASLRHHVMMNIVKENDMSRNRFANENAAEKGKMPRIVYPNDILPDDNSLSEASSESNLAEMKSLTSNPRG